MRRRTERTTRQTLQTYLVSEPWPLRRMAGARRRKALEQRRADRSGEGWSAMISTTATSPRLTPAQVFAAISRYRISLTSAFDGRIWLASVELKGSGANRKRNLQIASATGPTPIAAVEALLNKLNGAPTPVALFE